MENQTENKNESCCGSGVCGCKVDFNFIFDRAKKVILNPKTCWADLKNEPITIKELYTKYILVLAAIPALCGFIKQVIFGVSIPFLGTWRMPFFSGLIYSIVQYLVTLGMLYVAAVIIDKLAPRFEGKTDTTTAFKLTAYSVTPSLILGVMMLFPAALAMLGGLLGLYGFYLLYEGIPAMTGVPEAKRNVFCAATIGCLVVAGIVVGLIVTSVARPAMPEPSFSKTNINMEQIEKGLKKFQELMPQ